MAGKILFNAAASVPKKQTRWRRIVEHAEALYKGHIRILLQRLMLLRTSCTLLQVRDRNADFSDYASMPTEPGLNIPSRIDNDLGKHAWSALELPRSVNPEFNVTH